MSGGETTSTARVTPGNYGHSYKPFATGGVDVNSMPEEEKDRVASAYLGNVQRLAAIKAKCDPRDLFRMNQNIRPTL